jgi:hypothetical protein
MLKRRNMSNRKLGINKEKRTSEMLDKYKYQSIVNNHYDDHEFDE